MRKVHTDLPKTNLTKFLAKSCRRKGYYVLVEDHGLHLDMVISDELPPKLKYVVCDDELHKLDS